MRNVNQVTQNYGDNMSYYGYLEHSELYHHGIKGQKWGVRRYQNLDGSLTNAGRRRYNINWAESKPGWYYKTGQSINDQSKMYKDIKKAFNKENKNLTKEELDSLISKEYKRIYKDNPDIQYNLGKSSYEFKRGVDRYHGGLIAGTVDVISQMKKEDSPVSRHGKYTDEILRKTTTNVKNDYSVVGKRYEKKNGSQVIRG